VRSDSSSPSHGPGDQSPVYVTKAQLAALLSQSAAAGLANPAPGSSPQSGFGTSATSSPNTPPVISINGENRAIVHVGDTYADLGATITGPQADLNLGVHLFLNGSPVDAIQLDTTAAATDTIDYVATDSAGLTSTSTRTVIIQPAQSPSIVPFSESATSSPDTVTSTTTTAQ